MLGRIKVRAQALLYGAKSADRRIIIGCARKLKEELHTVKKNKIPIQLSLGY